MWHHAQHWKAMAAWMKCTTSVFLHGWSTLYFIGSTAASIHIKTQQMKLVLWRFTNGNTLHACISLTSLHLELENQSYRNVYSKGRVWVVIMQQLLFCRMVIAGSLEIRQISGTIHWAWVISISPAVTISTNAFIRKHNVPWNSSYMMVYKTYVDFTCNL